jgi:DedD protein
MVEQAVNDDHAEIKKRAMQRLIVAGALVAAAVIALTVLSNKTDERATPVNTPKIPAITTTEPTPPETVQESSEKTAAETQISEEPPVPDSEAAPAIPPPPPPQVVNKPNQTTPKAAAKENGVPEKTSEPQAVTISPAPAAKKPAEPMAAASKPAVAATASPVKTAEPIAPKGYVVQLGLFSNHENAVQLQKRLADHGIKSHTETRLHVGPFQNKADADQAMNKIRGMGINAVLAPAR